MWSAEKICDYFDSHPNVTLRQLSYKAGRSVEDIKRILIGVK